MLTLADLAQALNVPKSTIRSWVHRGQIPFVRLAPKSLRFRREEIDAWIASRSQRAA